MPEAVSGKSSGRLSTLLRAFRHRNYRLFFFGQFVSLIGTWMQSIAQSWLVYRLTDSEILLGLVGFAGQFPVFLLAPFGGVLADRFAKRRILLVTQSASMLIAFLLAALTLSGDITVWEIFVLASLLGIANGFDIPTRQAFVVEMVGREDLANAIALNSSVFNGARIIGPAVAGVLVAAIGEGWCFLLNALSFMAVLGAYAAMHLAPFSAAPRRQSVLGDIAEGMRFARHNIPVRSLLLLLALVSLTGMPYVVLMPIFAAEILHGGAQALGLLMGCAGLGALIAALTLAARRSARGLGTWVMVAAGGFGVCLVAFAFSQLLWLSAILLVPVGFFMMVQMASSNTLLQMMTPDALRGRVMALYVMMFMGMAPLGALLAGSIAAIIGAPWTVAIGGLASLIGALAFGHKLTAIRAAAHELIVAQQMAAGQPAQAAMNPASENK